MRGSSARVELLKMHVPRAPRALTNIELSLQRQGRLSPTTHHSPLQLLVLAVELGCTASVCRLQAPQHKTNKGTAEGAVKASSRVI